MSRDNEILSSAEKERQAYMEFERALVADQRMAATDPKRMAWALWKQTRSAILGLQKDAVAGAYAAGYTQGVAASEGGYVDDVERETAEWIESEAAQELLKLAGISTAAK